MKYAKVATALLLAGGLALPALATASSDNKITPSLQSVEVMHKGKKVSITRAADRDAHIPEAYDKTGRHCPPFCVQPISAAPGVETIGELELLGYLKRIADGDGTVMVVDSRTPDWMARGTIPGSVNIPWDKINVDMGGTFAVETEAQTLNQILTEQFGAMLDNGSWNFDKAKTLVLFCNGNWCPQSTINIKTLIKLGYPAYKLKWYRGGMQDWVSLGLTTVTN